MLKQIVATDENWGIGRKNRLLFSIPEDMKFFKDTTSGKTVVMGYNTLLSLPGGLPLKNRLNIILSSKENLLVKDAVVCRSLDQLGALLSWFCHDEVFVIGGHSVYRQMLPYSAVAFVTKVAADGSADRFYPDMDSEAGWELRRQSKEKQHEGLRFRFCDYVNRNPASMPGTVVETSRSDSFCETLKSRILSGISANDLDQIFE